MNGSSQDDDGTDPLEGASESGLSKRRAQLDRKLKDLHVAEQAAVQKSHRSATGYAQAVKISSEFIAGVLVGAGIGWVADEWLGTSPFGLIVFLLLGFAAGVLNVMRSAGLVTSQDEQISKQKSRKDGP
ncbi:AtpZ/AtpI family protein [Roseibium aggregatum]|uniref:ATP synthase protein I n=1 Tax=Roseibium aggregatum TaxID=187304 RepID=A0A926NWA6_9HYPH|nr:AtpZ/AtpI family protein [Roseibium aggregatum]MBD1547564.1 ATP F0F1 synthase subunit I [Roseibium aggregatum]